MLSILGDSPVFEDEAGGRLQGIQQRLMDTHVFTPYLKSSVWCREASDKRLPCTASNIGVQHDPSLRVSLVCKHDWPCTAVCAPSNKAAVTNLLRCDATMIAQAVLCNDGDLVNQQLATYMSNELWKKEHNKGGVLPWQWYLGLLLPASQAQCTHMTWDSALTLH